MKITDYKVAAEGLSSALIEAMRERFSTEEFADRMKECELPAHLPRIVLVPADLMHLLT